MRQEPLQNIEEPSAVNRWTPSTEEDLGPGNTETEAPESTRNSRSERISFTNRRVGLQNSPGAVATEGPAGWTEVSTCRTTRFPKRNRVFCSWRLSHHVSCETSIGQAELEIWTTEPESGTPGRRNLDGVGKLRSPRTGRNLGAGRNQVYLKRLTKIVGEEIHC